MLYPNYGLHLPPPCPLQYFKIVLTKDHPISTQNLLLQSADEKKVHTVFLKHLQVFAECLQVKRFLDSIYEPFIKYDVYCVTCKLGMINLFKPQVEILII